MVGEEKLSQLCTWVEAAYGVQLDLKSHTGGGISFGYELVHCKSRKKKLNKKSSTDAELVRVSDYLPYNIWIFLCMETQGYRIQWKTILKENQTTTRMEKNGKK